MSHPRKDRQSVRPEPQNPVQVSPDEAQAGPFPQAVVEDHEALFTIGALAKLCGVTVRTLRYYEEMDLIGPVKRSSGKYRLYNHRSLKRVRAILSLQDLNYSLEQILEILGPYAEALQFTKADRILATRRSLTTQRDFIEGKLRSLRQMKKDIETRITVLETVCENCLCVAPQVNCDDACEHRDIHLS